MADTANTTPGPEVFDYLMKATACPMTDEMREQINGLINQHFGTDYDPGASTPQGA